MDGRHDGDAEVDGRVPDPHPEAAVLGDALLGDVQLRHDLDAADDRAVVLLGDGLHRRLEHAIDPVLDHHFLVAGLDVDVGGATVQGVEDRRIHEADDGRLVGLDLVDGQDLVAVVVVVDDLDLERFRRLLQDALRSLAPLERLLDRRRGSHRRKNGRPEKERELVEHRDVRGVRHHQDEVAGLPPVGEEGVAKHQLDGDGLEQLGVGGKRGHVHELQAMVGRQRPGRRLLVRRRQAGGSVLNHRHQMVPWIAEIAWNSGR